jgi:hypothetical protein
VFFQEVNITKRIPHAGILQKTLFSFLLLFLPLVSAISVYVALLTAFIFTFLVPGLIFFRFFRLKSCEILAFIPIFSVLISTQLIYYLSLLLGYSQATILISFLAIAVAYALVNSRRKETYNLKSFLKTTQRNQTTLLIFLIIFTIALIILYRTI